MKPRVLQLTMLAVAICVVVLFVCVVRREPGPPVAIIRVVDAAGKPIAGAVIKPDGMRPKSGVYSSGHYGWRTAEQGVTDDPVKTDADGYARVAYPEFVFERIETGQISFSVKHPGFVSDRPFRDVATAPASGAPMSVWASYVWNRVRHNMLIARPDFVVLQKGAALKLSVRPGFAVATSAPLFAQATGDGAYEADFWSRPEPGVAVTWRLAAGQQSVRAIQFETNGVVWFGDIIAVSGAAGKTNELVVELKRGVTVRGQLDRDVPRPVTNGRVIANISSADSPSGMPSLRWHAWTAVREDGSFEMDSLPPGKLEVTALCDGFISTNGTGQFSGMTYPQKHVLTANDLDITIGMERTARLEVQIFDDQGNPLAGASVYTSPNVSYDGWGSTIFASDCYNSADQFLAAPDAKARRSWRSVPDFMGTSDAAGLAVVPNLPANVTSFSVEHDRYALPAVAAASGSKRREAGVILKAGETNHVAVRLELREQSPIAHY